jgi:hypothetical protein
MSLVAIDNSAIVVSIKADCLYLRGVIDYITNRYDIYSQNLNGTVMNAANIASGDQTFINAFVTDLNRIITLAGGTVPANADNISFNINALLGLS